MLIAVKEIYKPKRIFFVITESLVNNKKETGNYRVLLIALVSSNVLVNFLFFPNNFFNPIKIRIHSGVNSRNRSSTVLPKRCYSNEFEAGEGGIFYRNFILQRSARVSEA